MNLKTMSLKQLQTLIKDAQKLEKQKAETIRLDALKENSSEIQRLKKEYKALKQSAKELEKYSFELTVPMMITVKSECYYNDLCDYDGVQDLFEFEFSGKLSKNHNFTKKQQRILNEAINEAIYDACDEFLEVTPDEYRNKIKEFHNRASVLLKDVKKLNLVTEDIQ